MKRRRGRFLWFEGVSGVLALGFLAAPVLAQPPACPNCGRDGVGNGGEAPVIGPEKYRDLNSCATIPRGAIPAPLGTYVKGFERWQTFKAAADRFVIYRNEWYMCGKDLGPYGSDHMEAILQRLQQVPFPVVVEVDSDPELNEARRRLVVAILAQGGVPDAGSRVILGHTSALNLRGDEAPRIYNQMLTNSGGNQNGQNFGRNVFPGFNSVPGGGVGGLPVGPAPGALP